MKVTFSGRALRQLSDIQDYIAQDNPIAAAKLEERIERLAFLLGNVPEMGRATTRRGIRAISVRPFPYVMFYRRVPERDELRIISMRHTSRRPSGNSNA